MSIQPTTGDRRKPAPPARVRRIRLAWAAAALLCVAATLLVVYAATWSRPLPPEGKNALVIRGQQQDVYFYPAEGGAADARKVLFLCGDGGWYGAAPNIAAEMAKAGYDVYGFDTKRYLESFTTDAGALKVEEVERDMAEVARWMQTRWGERVTAVGWSTGAAFAVLAAAPSENKGLFDGVVTFGLSDRSELGWRARDDITYVTGAGPDEPMFSTAEHVGRIAPLPVYMIHASGDQYIKGDEAERLFAAAREPKLYKLVEARGHAFEGNAEGFYEALREGLSWVKQNTR